MRLNLPVLDQLQTAQRILIAGAGGGFDIFTGLPLYYTLREQGKTVFLANLSFTEFVLAAIVSETVRLEGGIMGARGGVKHALPYMPEPCLSDWFKKFHAENITIWMLPNEGAEPLRVAYTHLVDHLEPDALILVDGGVDSIMRGDEIGSGTLLEDTLTLVAVEKLDIPIKILSCLGFGTEVEEQVCHYNALENMAALVKAGAFYGSCALTPQMEAFQFYESACRYVFDQPGHHQSHISTRVIPAVHGEFGNFHMTDYHRKSGIQILVSPLMSLYWFFDAKVVIEHNTLIPHLRGSNTKIEALHTASHFIRDKQFRPRRSLPY